MCLVCMVLQMRDEAPAKKGMMDGCVCVNHEKEREKKMNGGQRGVVWWCWHHRIDRVRGGCKLYRAVTFVHKHRNDAVLYVALRTVTS